MRRRGTCMQARVEAMLHGNAESKKQAETALQRAMAGRSTAGLRQAIQQAWAAGVDASEIGHGEEVLRLTLDPRRRSLEHLARVQEGVPTVSELRAAVRAARSAKLEAAEYRHVEIQLEQKELALTEVEHVMDEVRGVNASCLEELQEAKAALSEAVAHAKGLGIAARDLREAELRRRWLHNAVENLKGSIRVFCRIRPLNRRETEMQEACVACAVDPMTLAVGSGLERAHFSFDAVFAPGTQEEVFESCHDLIQSALDGYNVTMFSYGQTGAGKTFTMYGSLGLEGLAPRAIRELYELVQRDQCRIECKVSASMVELYRNELVDLLAHRLPSRRHASEAHGRLSVHVDRGGGVHVDHLTQEECRDAGELLQLLERGNRQRTVAATAMNSQSSRSHLVMTITISSTNKETQERLHGKILICDLAGSERLKRSEVSGDAQKEAIEINKSLTALGDVIEALTKGEKHIPYKNHKLTQLMQDALGGTSKTLMVVACSPAAADLEETTVTLRYAARAKQIPGDARGQLPRASSVQPSRASRCS